MQAAPPKKKRSLTPVIVLIVLGALTIPCVGILAAVAIPAFLGFIRRSKTAEAEQNLRSLFSGAAAYYAEEHVGPDGTVRTRCTVGPAITGNVPGPQRTQLSDVPESFSALGFTPYDPIYFRYEIVSVPGCDHPDGAALYSFRAHGDLDGDGVTSLFELTAESDLAGDLSRPLSISRQDEFE